jgi:GNAT superfamily N-acetyltransferase
MTTDDLCLAWSWEYDADFAARLGAACARRGLTLHAVTPATLADTLARVVSGNLAFRAFFDRASDGDPAFLPLVEWAASHVPVLINPFAAARRAWDKATMHLEFITAGLYTPHTIILPPYHERPDLFPSDLAPLGGQFSIKPAHGGGGVGVVNQAEAWAQVTAARQRFPADKYLLQEWITPALVGGRRAWFRVIHCCGQTFPCWWDSQTHVYTPVTPSEESLYNLSRLREMTAIIARVCGLQLFSTEIAWTTDGRLLSVDYVNDPLDLRAQSQATEGVPDEIVTTIAACLAEWVAEQTRACVRPATVADIPVLLPLLEELGRPHADPADAAAFAGVTDVYRQHIADPDRLVLVAEVAGRIVGALDGAYRTRLNWPTRELWIADLIVTESAHGLGIGRALMNDVITRARQAGCHGIALESGHARQVAHQLYQSLGFEDKGIFFVLDLRPDDILPYRDA